MEEFIGKSVNVPDFLETLKEEYNWATSHHRMFAEKHFKEPESGREYAVIILIGGYKWDIHKIRFDKLPNEEDEENGEEEREKVSSLPKSLEKQVLKEINNACENSSDLPPEIKERLKPVGSK